MKIKIIDLLIKNARGEEMPETVGFAAKIWIYVPNMQDYFCKDEPTWLFSDWLGEIELTHTFLNREVEIIEEDKQIERFDVSKKRTDFYCTPIEMEIMCKINEVIDAVNNKLKVDD